MSRSRMMACCAEMVLMVSVQLAWSAEVDPKAIVRQAIKAHGGEQELNKHQVVQTQFKGVVHSPSGDTQISGDIYRDGPIHQRLDARVETAGFNIQLVSVVADDHGWIKVSDGTNAMVLDLDAEKLAQGRSDAYSQWLSTLTPLLAAETKLASRGDVKVGDRPAEAIIASRDNRPDVHLFFDQETHLLVKSERRVKDDAGVEVTEETFYQEPAADNGRQAQKIKVTRNEKPHAEFEVLSVTPKEKLDKALFARPE